MMATGNAPGRSAGVKLRPCTIGTFNVAKKLGVKPIQLALAWVLSNPAVHAEAVAAVKRIADSIKAQHPEAAEDALMAETESRLKRIGLAF